MVATEDIGSEIFTGLLYFFSAKLVRALLCSSVEYCILGHIAALAECSLLLQTA